MPDVRQTTRRWVPAFSEEFLARAADLFRETNHVMVVGPLGSGRGSLATKLAGSAASSAWGRGTTDAPFLGRPYAVLNQLVPPLRAAADEPVDEVVARTTDMVGSTFAPPTFVIHEIEMVDDGTLEVVAALVASGAIRLISTIGAAAADSHRLSRNAARIDLPPLDDDTITNLLAERFDAVPHPMTVAMLAERSQGAYAVLRRLADAAFEVGELKILAGMLVLDAGVSIEAADVAAGVDGTAWLPRFGGDLVSRDLIDVAALCLDVDSEEAVALFGSEAVAEALHVGAVRRDHGTLSFASRIEADLLRRSLRHDRRAELYAQYGDRMVRSFSVPAAATWIAGWVLSVGGTLTPELAVRAVTRANRQGRYSLALEISEAIERSEWPPRLVIEVGHALAESGATDDLAALVRDVDAATLPPADQLVFLRLAGRCLDPEDLESLVVRLESVALDADDTATLATIALLRLLERAYDDGAAEIGRALNSLVFSARLDPENHAMALVAHAVHLRHISESERALRLVGEAVQILEGLPLAATGNLELAREVQILTYVTNVDFLGAQAALQAYSGDAARFGNVGRLGTALWGIVSFFSGDLANALAHATLCLARMPVDDSHQLRGWVEAMAAQILVQVGAIEEAEERLAASASRAPHPRRQLDMERRLTRACVHDSLGDPEEALDILQPMVAEARERGLRLQEVDAATLCVQIGGPQHLPLLLEATRDIGEGCGTSTIWRRFALAIDANDMGALAALALDLHESRLHLFAAEVAQFTLDIARRASDMTPDTRAQLLHVADPMSHRQVSRPAGAGSDSDSDSDSADGAGAGRRADD